MSDWVLIDCDLDDLQLNGKVLKFKNKTIALFKDNKNLMAFGNRCPHRGGSIGNGTLKNGIISCPWHNWKFDPKTGKAIENEIHCLKTYPIEKRNDGVYIKLK
tara:strand:- start:17896 stop:18204 length:309 start_codon:yes stop_codon:yes gene_type:complete